MLLDGYAIVRREDITEVSNSFESRGFVERALKLRGFIPKAPTRVFPLSSLPLALGEANARFSLVTVHRERSFRDSCWIGQVLRTSNAGFLLREISPSAEFTEQRWYRFSGVTCLEFGGLYEGALAAVAGLQPNPSLQRTRFARR